MELNISEASNVVKISKETIRYYEDLGLVSPKRSSNGYRVFNDKDIFQLKCIQVLKYSGFTLDEAKMMLTFRNNENDCEKIADYANPILNKKLAQIEAKIIHYNSIVKLLKQVIDMQQTSEVLDKSQFDELCIKIFNEISYEGETK